MSQAIELKIREFVVDTFLFGRGGEKLGDQDSLVHKGIIDSTGVLELVGFLEEAFHVQIDDGDIAPDNFDSISRLVAFVNRKQAEVTS